MGGRKNEGRDVMCWARAYFCSIRYRSARKAIHPSDRATWNYPTTPQVLDVNPVSGPVLTAVRWKCQ